jgi:hypothetical protein
MFFFWRLLRWPGIHKIASMLTLSCHGRPRLQVLTLSRPAKIARLNPVTAGAEIALLNPVTARAEIAHLNPVMAGQDCTS